MKQFFTFLEEHLIGVILLILIIFSVVLVINWLAKIFSIGMFKNRKFEYTNQSNFTYVVSTFFANLINDFKHFLALVVVLMFTALIIYSMTSTDIFDQKMEALKLVIASLGGLLGSIIGYYFGESAGRNSGVQNITSSASNIQGNNNSDSDGIEQAPEIPEQQTPETK